MKNQLGDLTNPKLLQGPISMVNLSQRTSRKMLETMIVIRKTEQQLAVARKNGLIGGPVHLGAGQEAIAVGI